MGMPLTFLAPVEVERWSQLRFEKRRRDWLLGRWTLKCLLQDVMARTTLVRLPLAAFVIKPGPQGAPEVTLDMAVPGAVTLRQVLGDRTMSVSISHSGTAAFCGVALPEPLAPDKWIRLGADIEGIEPRSAAFVSQCMTRDEVALLEVADLAQKDALVTAIWSAKEAVLKALRLGLTVDTAWLSCIPHRAADGCSGRWAPLEVQLGPRLAEHTTQFEGYWRVAGSYVQALAVTEGMHSKSTFVLNLEEVNERPFGRTARAKREG